MKFFVLLTLISLISKYASDGTWKSVQSIYFYKNVAYNQPVQMLYLQVAKLLNKYARRKQLSQGDHPKLDILHGL